MIMYIYDPGGNGGGRQWRDGDAEGDGDPEGDGDAEGDDDAEGGTVTSERGRGSEG